jgi:predicted RNase H-like HicB family nuclease
METMEALDFEILGTFYRLDGVARLAKVIGASQATGRMKYRVHKMCEEGLLERTPDGSYLLTPKGRERFLNLLAQREPESPLLRRRKLVIAAKIEALDEGGYLAFSDDIQGCHAEGETVAEALANLEDVARVILEMRRDDGRALPEHLLEYKANRTLQAELVVALPE